MNYNLEHYIIYQQYGRAAKKTGKILDTKFQTFFHNTSKNFNVEIKYILAIQKFVLFKIPNMHFDSAHANGVVPTVVTKFFPKNLQLEI